MANRNEGNLWDAIGNWFGDLWNKITNPNKGGSVEQPTDPNGDIGNGQAQENKNFNDGEKLKGDAIYNMGGYIKPKTFDEWLGDQKLSRDEKSENYFGNFYKKTAQSLVDQAYSNKTSLLEQVDKSASRAGTASHNAFSSASSNFSNGSERMFSNGLKSSGFSNYLKGISYLAYRDEIGKTNNTKLGEIAGANKDYSDKVIGIEGDQAKQISDREKELLKLYLDSVGKNQDMNMDLIKGK